MKKILVPIDLSEGSENAINIARNLSDQTKADITILHVVSSPRGAVLLEDGTVKDDGEHNLKVHQTKALEVRNRIEEKFDALTNINVKVKIGGVNEIILNELKASEYSLLVLGMTGQLAASFWTNSHTEYLSKHAQVPVLTLKCDRSNMSFEKIVFVSDFLQSEEANLSILRIFSNYYKSRLVLLKIVTEDQQRSEEEITSTAEAFAKENLLENFEVVIHKDVTVEEGIATFCNQNNIDLIAIGTHQRGGFSTLFRRSVSQNIVRSLYHPIITIPIA